MRFSLHKIEAEFTTALRIVDPIVEGPDKTIVGVLDMIGVVGSVVTDPRPAIAAIVPIEVLAVPEIWRFSDQYASFDDTDRPRIDEAVEESVTGFIETIPIQILQTPICPTGSVSPLPSTSGM